MKTYTVSFKIDVCAENHRQAANKAYKYLTNRLRDKSCFKPVALVAEQTQQAIEVTDNFLECE